MRRLQTKGAVFTCRRARAHTHRSTHAHMHGHDAVALARLALKYTSEHCGLKVTARRYKGIREEVGGPEVIAQLPNCSRREVKQKEL